MSDLSTPDQIRARLEAIDHDLAIRQNTFEAAGLAWFRVKRDREHKYAVAFMSAEGSVTERRAAAERETAMIGTTEEAEWESLKGVVRVLETRATIGMALLKSQGRA